MSTSTSTTTYGSVGIERLTSLWRALTREACPDDVGKVLREMLGPLGDAPVPAAAPWPSVVSDDHSPFAFSVALGGPSPELRVIVEAQGATPSLASNAASGLALHRALAARGADLSGFERVRDLFLPVTMGEAQPEQASGRFALLHSVSWAPGRAPSFMVGLDPHARGEERSFALVEEALERLGFDGVWPAVTDVARRCPPRDDLRFMWIELSKDARVELVLWHHEADAAVLEGASSSVPGHRPRGAAELYTMITGTAEARRGVAPATRLTLARGRRAPVSSAHYIPVRSAAESDRVARDRIRGYLKQVGLPASPYDLALEAAARRPLDAGSGLHLGVSLESGSDGPRLEVSFSPEVFGAMPAGAPELPALDAPERIVEIYEHSTIANHPFLQRLRRNPINPAALWMLVVNVRAGIALHFARRLTHVLARMDKLEIRSIFAKQLNDELGDGDATRAHIVLFDRLIAGLDVYRPADPPPRLLAPGEEWNRRLEEIYSQRDAYEGVGAAMVIEIIGKQADCFVADEFRRQEIVPKIALEWLHLHEELEQEHSSESLDLGKLVPRDPEVIARVWRGARDCGACCWAFADDMYRLCYG